jgi:hypothetical protein
VRISTTGSMVVAVEGFETILADKLANAVTSAHESK